jgi:hypothetical protein
VGDLQFGVEGGKENRTVPSPPVVIEGHASGFLVVNDPVVAILGFLADAKFSLRKLPADINEDRPRKDDAIAIAVPRSEVS